MFDITPNSRETMSMTLINFVQNAKLPTKNELENKIKELGYNFKFLSDFEKFDAINKMDSIACELNGIQTFVQMHQNPAKEILSNLPNLKEDVSNKDLAISFTVSSDEAVKSSIHIISIGLIDLSQSIVLQSNDKIFYSREMLLQDTSNSFKYNGTETSSIPKKAFAKSLKSGQKKKREKKIENIKTFTLWGILFLGTILIQKGIITWTVPIVLFILVITLKQIDLGKRKKSKV